MERVIHDRIGYISNTTENKWMAKQSVYNILRYDSSYQNVTSTLNSFYNSVCPSGIKQIQDIEDSIDAGYYVVAQTMTSVFTPVNTIETNYKTYYRLFLNYMLNGIWSGSDSNTLWEMTQKCIFIEGPVVLNARIFYNSLYRNQYTVFEDNCGEEDSQGEGRLATKNSNNGTFDVEVFPNPASKGFEAKSNCKENCEIHIEGYDIQGNKVIDKLCNQNEGHCFVEIHLSNGNYLLKITKMTSKETVLKRLSILN